MQRKDIDLEDGNKPRKSVRFLSQKKGELGWPNYGSREMTNGKSTYGPYIGRGSVPSTPQGNSLLSNGGGSESLFSSQAHR